MVGMKILECEILVDKEFEQYILSNIWHVRKTSSGQIYFYHFDHKKRISLHRYITNCPKGMVVDHINGNTLDNRKENLRICTNKENAYNQKKHKGNRHSKYKGVTFRKELKSKPWEAMIYKDYKSKRLGYFATEIEAAKAYNMAAAEAYGQFAKLNEIED